MNGHLSTAAIVPLQVREHALTRPSAPAIRGPDHQLTYALLDRWAAAIAGYLRACGLAGPGVESVVGVLLPPSAGLVAASLGVLYSGSAYLPLDPDPPAERTGAILRDAGCTAVVTSPELTARVPAGTWPVVVAGGPLPAGQLLAPPEESAIDALACVIGASGVSGASGASGHPEVVAVTHGGLSNLWRWHAHAFALAEDDRAALVSSPCPTP
jgi:non-ribosomal peptide synthetase component F